MNKLKNAVDVVFGSLFRLKGNAKVNLLVQPMFSIPFNIYTTYVSLYMLGLGISKTEIGLVNSIAMVAQIAFSLVSFYLVDKFGRKWMSIVGDWVGWLVPVFIWATAQSVEAFVLAAIINGVIRINIPAYNCLITEGYDGSQRYHIFSWMQLSNLVGWFFVPVGGYLVAKLGIVPAGRAMYWTAFVSFTLMFIIRLFLIRETDMGVRRRAEMKGVGPIKAMREYMPVIKKMFQNKYLVAIMVMKGLAYMCVTFRNTYLGIIATRRLGFADADVSIFMTVNAIVLALVLFFVMPAFNRKQSGKPIIIGYMLDIAGVLILLITPYQNMTVILIAVTLMAAGYGMEYPTSEALFSNTIDDHHRSLAVMISGIVYLALSTPMSYVVGALSEYDDSIPFVVMGVLYAMSAALYAVCKKLEKKQPVAG